MQVIGIDIGTTGICGVALDVASGALLRSVTVDSEAFLPTDKPFEKIQSVDRILTVAEEILSSLLDGQTAAIGVTGQMHGILYYDADGVAVSPLYTWQDKRGDEPYGDTTYAAALGSHSGYGCVTDFYNRENGLVPEEAVGYCTIHDYLVMRLCGNTRPKIHLTDAASFGCFDLARGCFTVENGIVPVSGFCLAGTHRGIPVSVAIGDNQASVFSSLPSEDAVLLNVGTGSQISVIADAPLFAEGIETRPYFDGKVLLVGSALCGGRAFALLKDFYSRFLAYAAPDFDGSVYAIMDRMLALDAPTSLKVDTRFSGSRADERVRGSITNIDTENFTPEGLTKGVLDGMVEELYGMYRAIGVQKSALVGSGNGIRKNPVLSRICSARFGAPMQIPRHTEEAAFGAALYALVASGVCPDAAAAARLISLGDATASWA